MKKRERSKSKTPATKRSRVKYPALKKNYNSKIRQEYLDYDYVDKLSEKDKEWLNSFTEEYLAANFNHGGKRIHKSHKQRVKSYRANNSRNRDVQAIHKATKGLIGYTQKVQDMLDEKRIKDNQDSIEDSLIEFIDDKLFKKKNVE